MLQKVTYPDSANSDDVVRFAYNAQGQEIWKKDQAGGVIETTYDLAGRATSRAVTTLASGFDGAVRRIETAYDSRGRVETVTQYNAASSGSVVDQVKYIHDGWGNLTNFRQDLDSTVGGSGYWEVAYAYAKATSGRNTLRRTQTTLPGGEVFKFHYRTGTASHDDKYSRVTTVRDAEDTDLAGYQYNGAGQVVRTELSEVGIFSKSYNGSGTTFGRLDRFNRTLISSWTRDLATNRDIHKVTLGYDRNSNITSQDDAVHTGHDVAYANDDLNRLIDADEGTLSGGSIGTRTRRQQWTLNQTGNWNRDKVDLNGDADYLDAGELDDTRTHNAVNELLTRDTNTSSPAEFNFAYDAAGNMTDDGVYKYEWDAFYRLRKVKNQSNALVSEYWYNGLGYLVTRHQDTDADGDVDGSDQKFHTAYDERWRQVATYRGSDANPKERFLYHWAGNGGFGGSSYIDSVVLRDRDMTNGWTGAADGTLEERVYYLQNWRADVVGLVEPDGSGGATLVEWVKYSAYGVPFGLPAGDTDSDGDCDSTDDAQVTTWKNAPSYDVRGDLDLDGDVDATDESLVGGAHQALGRSVLTSTSIGNRKGYAGYEADAKLSAKWHVRHRVLDSVLGRWLRRDPLGYVDLPSVLGYVANRPTRFVDPRGTTSSPTGGGQGTMTFSAYVKEAHVQSVSIEDAAKGVLNNRDDVDGDFRSRGSDGTLANAVKHCYTACLTCGYVGEGGAFGASVIVDGLFSPWYSSESMDYANDIQGLKCCNPNSGSAAECLKCCLWKAYLGQLWVNRGPTMFHQHEIEFIAKYWTNSVLSWTRPEDRTSRLVWIPGHGPARRCTD